MDTNMFSYALTIAECKGISAAARRLFMSQPALTKQIGKLEAELGFKVFDRGCGPLAVTSQGELFLDFASKYLELEHDFKNRLGQAAQKLSKPVRVATTNRGGHYAGEHTAAFLKEYPEICLEYLDMSAQKCEEALEDELVDLAIYTDPVLSDRIEYMPLEEDLLIFAVPRGNRLLEGKDIRDNHLDNPVQVEIERFRDPAVKYVLSTPNHSLYFAECAFLKKYRIQPAAPLRVDFVNTRYAIACGGGGIVLIPHTTVSQTEKGKDMIYCTVKGENLYRYVIIAKKKGRQLSPEAQTVWRFMVGQRF